MITKKTILVLFVAFSLSDRAHAQPDDTQATQADASVPLPSASGAPSSLVWHTADFFGPCDGDCSAALYAGREITSPMTGVFLLHKPIAPWDWKFGGAGVVAATASRRFATLFDMIDLEAEAGIDHRLGDMHATLGWLAVDVRWTYFPWNDFVKTTIALADGPSYASIIDTQERLQSGNGSGSHFLNFFSPEITFARPSHPDDELVLRYEHRSGMGGLINGVTDGSSFVTIGYRRLF